MIELYGIRETLGVCEEVTEVPADLKNLQIIKILPIIR